MLDARYYLYLFGLFPMFLRECIFLAPFCFTFSLFFSLSGIFFTYRWIFYMLVQVKQIGWVLQSFYYKDKGRGRFVQQVGRG